jgi:CspA family cold shock protein
VTDALKGTITRWLNGRGYGFIEPEEGDEDIFLHLSEVEDAYLIEEGKEVEFQVQDTYKGQRAINAKIVEN